MADTPTIGKLYKLKHVTNEQVVVAAADSLEDPTLGMQLIAKGAVIDIAAVVANHKWARDVIDDPALSDRARRMNVRTTILLARPA